MTESVKTKIFQPVTGRFAKRINPYPANVENMVSS